MPSIKFPGIRSVVTWVLLGTVAYAGLSQVPDNANIEVMRKLMEYAVVFFFGTKVSNQSA